MAGGINFDAKLRRESTSVEDLFIGHISGMDTLARGLRNAASLMQEGLLPALVEQRYGSWSTGLGKDIRDGKVGLMHSAVPHSEAIHHLLVWGSHNRCSGWCFCSYQCTLWRISIW